MLQTLIYTCPVGGIVAAAGPLAYFTWETFRKMDSAVLDNLLAAAGRSLLALKRVQPHAHHQKSTGNLLRLVPFRPPSQPTDEKKK